MRVIRCDGSAAAVAALETAVQRVLDGGEAVAPLGPGSPAPARDPGPGHVVVTTSGSTGQPKHVQLSAAALGASAMATHARLGAPGHWLLALPAQHVAGLQVLVRAILTGAGVTVLDLRDGFDPARFRAAAHRPVTGPAPRYTALVPTQLARLLDTEPGALTGFDAVLLGGSAAPEGLRRRARAAGVPLVCTYGMTETAGGCVYDGTPLDGVAVRLDGDSACGPGADAASGVDRGAPIGRIALSGPMLATGYLDAPAQTATAFCAGWFLTCDLGRLDGQGRLQVLGRADDVIVTGGINVAPAEVEAVLTGLPGVLAACAVGLPDPEWGQRVAAAVVPADPARPPEPGELRAAARALLTGAQAPKQIAVLDALPMCGVGKPDRRAVRAVLTAEAGTRATR